MPEDYPHHWPTRCVVLVSLLVFDCPLSTTMAIGTHDGWAQWDNVIKMSRNRINCEVCTRTAVAGAAAYVRLLYTCLGIISHQ